VCGASSGFPCGLWLLFHLLAAECVSVQAERLLGAIQRVVAELFLCLACRAHFLELLAHCALDCCRIASHSSLQV